MEGIKLLLTIALFFHKLINLHKHTATATHTHTHISNEWRAKPLFSHSGNTTKSGPCTVFHLYGYWVDVVYTLFIGKYCSSMRWPVVVAAVAFSVELLILLDWKVRNTFWLTFECEVKRKKKKYALDHVNVYGLRRRSRPCERVWVSVALRYTHFKQTTAKTYSSPH